MSALKVGIAKNSFRVPLSESEAFLARAPAPHPHFFRRRVVRWQLPFACGGKKKEKKNNRPKIESIKIDMSRNDTPPALYRFS